LTDYEAGRLRPVPVRLGEFPAGDDDRRVADDMRLLMGLRLAVGEDRPLPYSARFAAWRMGWILSDGQPNAMRASRAIRRLCGAGVIFCTGTLSAHGRPYGTKTYAPPLGVGASVVEGEAVTIEAGVSVPRAEQPETEVREQGGVKGAVVAERLDGGHASGNGAGRVHGGNGNGALR
jgi:hypothetical protein